MSLSPSMMQSPSHRFVSFLRVSPEVPHIFFCTLLTPSKLDFSPSLSASPRLPIHHIVSALHHTLSGQFHLPSSKLLILWRCNSITSCSASTFVSAFFSFLLNFLVSVPFCALILRISCSLNTAFSLLKMPFSRFKFSSYLSSFIFFKYYIKMNF